MNETDRVQKPSPTQSRTPWVGELEERTQGWASGIPREVTGAWGRPGVCVQGEVAEQTLCGKKPLIPGATELQANSPKWRA